MNKGKGNVFYSDTWRLVGLGVIAGMVLMVALTETYHLAGSSRFCASCHSMEYVYSKWQISKHKQFSCIECHMPDAHIIAKLAYKARAGINDLVHEVSRDYPATIRLSYRGKNIMNGNCLRCHYSTIQNTPMAKGGQNCLKCHHNLVHGQGLVKGGLQFE